MYLHVYVFTTVSILRSNIGYFPAPVPPPTPLKRFSVLCCYKYVCRTAFKAEFAPWTAAENFVHLDHDHVSDGPAHHRARPAATGPLSQHQVCHREVVLNHAAKDRLKCEGVAEGGCLKEAVLLLFPQ